MNHRSAHKGRSERRSGGRSFEISRDNGCAATFAELDAKLEVRARLVAIIDSLDAGNAAEGAINVRLLLSDLDEASSS